MDKNILVKIIGKSKYIPFECPICQCLMRDTRDSACYADYDCCSECMIETAYPNKEKWQKGWRPSDKEFSKIRKNRFKVPSYNRIK
jgi:hypothetical protein